MHSTKQIIKVKRRFISILAASLIIAFSSVDIRAMAEKYPLQVTAEKKGKNAEIRITGTLYEWNNSSEEFTRKIDAFLAEGITDVDVYINSPGGDVFVAAEISNQIQRFTGAKKGIGGAIVASAATMIAIELDSFEMAENGQFMYHKPSAYLSGNEDKIEASLKLLKSLSSQYKKKYADKTGITEEEIEASWSKGDVWLTAQEAFDQKFISGIIKKQTITPETKALFEACGCPVIPEVNSKSEYKMKNRDQIISKLKLPADATDEQIEAAITASLESAERVKALEQKEKDQNKTMIKSIVDQAVIDKKFTADLAPNYTALLEKDFEGTKSIIDAMTPIAKPVIETTADGHTGREKWTMEDYQTKDPEALKVMMVKEPEKFKKLEAEYFSN